MRAALGLPLLLLTLAGACSTRAPVVMPAPVDTPTPVDAPAPGAAATPQPGADIDAILDAPPLHRTQWGAHVIDARTGAVLYSRDADRHFIPASNMKLIVAAAALDRLGEDYRFRTDLLMRPPHAAVPAGDSAAAVIVVGAGDPTWSVRFAPAAAAAALPDHERRIAAFDSMASIIARVGVRTVGELIVDASRFTDAGVHPAWEVSDLAWRFAAPVAAFAADEGTFSIVITGAAVAGLPADARVTGPLPQPVRVNVTTDTAGATTRIAVDYTARRDTVFVTGTIAPGAADTSTLALTQPARSAAAALGDALRRRGVRVGAVRVLQDTALARETRAGARAIGTWTSPPLRDIIAALMPPSQNWITEQVLKALGAERRADGSWAAGVDAALEFLYDAARIDSGAVHMRDGSGLSPHNLLTPAATVQLLAHAQAQPWGAAFRASLAAPGLEDSTLENRLLPLTGRVQAKTGTIANVNALSGYLVMDDGRELIFSIMSNASGVPAAAVRSAIDSAVLALARHAPAAPR